MGHLNWRRPSIYALTAIAVLWVTATPSFGRPQQDSSQSTGDPVADAARKARAKKKQEADKPKKVFTDDDLNHAVPEPATSEKPADSTDAKAAPAGENGKAATATSPDAGQSEEQKWRQRFHEAYKNLARTEKELDILQREANKAETQYYSDPQKAMQEQYTRKEINDKDTKIAAKKKEVADLKQQISDMQDDLRKAGGDPGWGNP